MICQRQHNTKMKKHIMLGTGIALCIAGTLVLALVGVTEGTRIIVTPCFTFGLMLIAFGTQRAQNRHKAKQQAGTAPNQEQKVEKSSGKPPGKKTISLR